MHDAVKRFQESDSDFSHSLEILFCFLAIVLLQCSEQQPFSYSVILWKWMNSQVEGKTKNDFYPADSTTKVHTMVHVVSAECSTQDAVEMELSSTTMMLDMKQSRVSLKEKLFLSCKWS